VDWPIYKIKLGTENDFGKLSENFREAHRLLYLKLNAKLCLDQQIKQLPIPGEAKQAGGRNSLEAAQLGKDDLEGMASSFHRKYKCQ